MGLTVEHLVGLIATLLTITVVGVHAARKVKTADDFTVGGHHGGPAMIVGTLAGTLIGGAVTMGTAQMAFSLGVASLWLTLAGGLTVMIMAIFYARPLRQSGFQTIPEYLVGSYGPAAGLLTSITASIGTFFAVVSNLLSAISLVATLLVLDPLPSAALVVALVLAYVFFGGVWGTGRVGIVKTLLTFATLGTVGWISWREMGGLAAYIQAFPAFPWFSLFGRGIWVDIGGALSVFVGIICTQTYVQAIYGARDVKAARQGAAVAGVIMLLAGIPAAMAGMFMRAAHPEIAAIEALPLFILYYLPPWFGGVAMATLLLASVGASSGLALGVSTMLSRDVLLVAFRGLGERTALWINRAIVLLIILFAVSITFGNLKTMVLEWNFLSLGLRGAGVFLPLTAAIFWPGHFDRRLAVWSMAAGACVAFGWKIVFPEGIDPLYPGLLANAVVFAAACLLGRKKAVAV
ncbi:MAG: sodium:solute symporter family protein [Negativicutes bacterium]|nr:sodium:solute symporter family protein [Negativicutes bacterium]